MILAFLSFFVGVARSSFLFLLLLPFSSVSLRAADEPPAVLIDESVPASDACLFASPDDVDLCLQQEIDDFKAANAPSAVHQILDALLAPAQSLYYSLSDPTACIVCDVLSTVLGVIRPIGAVGFDLLLIPSLVFLGLGLMFTVVTGAGKILLSPVQSSRPWSDLAVSGIRFVVALLLLGGASALSPSSFSTGSTSSSGVSSQCNSFDVLYGRLVEPLMGTGIALGMVLLDHVTVGSFTGSAGLSSAGEGPFLAGARDHARRVVARGNRSTFSGRCVVAPSSSTLGGPLLGFDNLLVYASSLQLLGSLGMAQGIGFLRDAQVVAEGGSRWIAFIAGVLILLLFAVFIIVAGIRLLDPLLRVTIVVAISPLLIVAWVFGPTRNAARVGLRVFAYAFFFFVVAGAIYGIAFTLILTSARSANEISPALLGKCVGHNAYVNLPRPPDPEVRHLGYCYCHPDAFETYDGLANCVLHNGGSLVLPPDAGTDSTRAFVDITKVLITLISLLLAQSLIALVTSIAGSLSDYTASDNIAQGAESQMRGLATSAVHTSAYAGASVIRTVGRKFF